MRRKHSKAGVVGVTQDLAGRYMAYITINRKTKHLGCFDDRFEAICARKSAENRRHLQPAEEKHVTTPERWLFERIKGFMVRGKFGPAKLICVDVEQRLAEAEAKSTQLDRCLLSVSGAFHIERDRRKNLDEEIAQLRARCGELEKMLRWCYDSQMEQLVRPAMQYDEWLWKIGNEMKFSTPQPAQEQTTK